MGVAEDRAEPASKPLITLFTIPLLNPFCKLEYKFLWFVFFCWPKLPGLWPFFNVQERVVWESPI